MQIHVPENLGGDLRLLPEGMAIASIDKCPIGKSKKGQPKVTFVYTIVEEMEINPEDAPTTVGETVLETFSLQPKAMFNLNNAYREVTGENLPQGDFSLEEFQQTLNEIFIGTEWSLMLENQTPSDGSSDEPRTTITSRAYRG